jgi:GNAT superfamily N-acetyltransferase
MSAGRAEDTGIPAVMLQFRHTVTMISWPGTGTDLSYPLRLLMDTNVFIALEPFAGLTEPTLQPATRLLRSIAEQGHRLFVHPAVADDLREGRDQSRRAQQLAELDKYPMLDETPIGTDLAQMVGASSQGTNDHRDLRLLAALHRHAVSYLISEDLRLARRAGRAGLSEAVLTINEAVALLDSLRPRDAAPPPLVEKITSYALDVEQPIFNSLRADYVGFDDWLKKVQAESEQRLCLIVRNNAEYAAISILKLEDDCPYSFGSPVLKISTFKVGSEYAGAKYGELLLKAIFAFAHERKATSLYIEVFRKFEFLIALLEEFGFVISAHVTGRNEIVLMKTLTGVLSEPLTDLEFHRRYGPPALRPSRVFLVPVEPRWHEQLFPDAPVSSELQLEFPGVTRPHPWGNALKKAYITQSKISILSPGDALLFYRSHDRKSVDAVGIVENTLRSGDPTEVLTFVGRRTVYAPQEIAGMCGSQSPPLAILFRQDRFLRPSWKAEELRRQGVMKKWPQSVTRVSQEGGLRWIRSQLTV